MRRPRLCVFLRLITILMLGVVPSLAQFQAGLQGTVRDNTGAVVSGASITATEDATRVPHTATSNASGFYRISQLPPGTYTVSIDAKGFKTSTLAGVVVEAETVRGFDVTMQLGGGRETVNVTAAPAALQTEDATISGTLTTPEVQNLPEIDRDPYELVRLAPGVFGDGARFGDGRSAGFPNGSGAVSGSAGPGGSNTAIFQIENQQPISAMGQRVTSNDYLVDGVSANSLAWGGAAVITPSIESVQEITVLANDYDAADGRSSGAHIKTVTKSGTNQFHGAGFFQYQDPGLNAYNKYNGYNFGKATFDPPVRDDNAYRQFGGNLGGAIIKNKLFFFFNYEGLRDNNSTFQDQWVDTSDVRSLIASYSPPGSPVVATLMDPNIA